MFWRLKSKVILLIILETIDFIVKSIFIVGVCKIGGVCIELFVLVLMKIRNGFGKILFVAYISPCFFRLNIENRCFY